MRMSEAEYKQIIRQAYDLAVGVEGSMTFDPNSVEEKVDGILVALGLPTNMEEFRDQAGTTHRSDQPA